MVVSQVSGGKSFCKCVVDWELHGFALFLSVSLECRPCVVGEEREEGQQEGGRACNWSRVGGWVGKRVNGWESSVAAAGRGLSDLFMLDFSWALAIGDAGQGVIRG